MTTHSSTFSVTDMFCGAGGSSTGAILAGAEVELAINHWPRALETHHANHPFTDHVLTDISTADPRRYPATTLLIASPECTNHSLSKGKKRKNLGLTPLPGFGDIGYDPREERSRCTMWDPLRWAEFHEYPLVILENVVDARLWVMWDAWLHAWRNLGYDYEVVYLNSMFANVPQSRDRMYFVAWRRGQRRPDLAIRPLATCGFCERQIEAQQCWKNPNKRAGKYRQQYIYACPTCARAITPQFLPAASAIDWSLPIEVIGDRKRPLKAKTMTRIQDGLHKATLEPFLLSLNHLRTQTTPVLATWPTVITYDDAALMAPAPFLLDQTAEYRPRSLTQPMSTVVGGGNHQGLVIPPAWLLSYYRNGSLRQVSEATPTVTTLERLALVIGQNKTGLTTRAEECGFRMLKPAEIQAAMAFPKDYIVTGTRREQVKQLGNAVTPPVMELLVRRCIASLSA